MAEHLEMVVRIVTVKGSEKKKDKNCRGYEVQQERREMERQVRIRAVELAGKLKDAGHPRKWLAPKLGMSAGALADWEKRWEDDGLESRPRGRPARQLPRQRREQVREMLHVLGPLEGVPTLQKRFPGLARAELEHLLRLYREEFVGENHIDVHALKWRRPGAVWAMDFNDPPQPIDRIFEHIFKVRDLGSAKSLAWLPTYNEKALGVCQTLKVLFRCYGPPLVIKEDNGGAFRSGKFKALLEEWGVEFLMSPPYYPEYNGSAEAGIGTLKTYAHHEAARNDRPGEWTCDDVEAARLRANELSRPHGLDGPTPNELWENRDPITPAERSAFRKLVESHYQANLAELRKEKGKEPNLSENATAKRQAVARALVESNILSIRRRRISPPIKSKFMSRIKR